MEQLRPSKDSIVKLHFDQGIDLTAGYISQMFPRYQAPHFNPVSQGHIENVLFMLKEPHVETKEYLNPCPQYRQIRRYAVPNRNRSVTYSHSHQLR
jgi:hypothetical protein